MITLAIVLAAGSLGAMLFFSAAVAPTVFQSLPPDAAGQFLRRLFPRYFVLNGIVAGAAAIAAAVAAAWVPTVLLVASAAALFGLRLVAVPAINQARDAMVAKEGPAGDGSAGDEAAGRRFQTLHRLTVLVNLAEMAALVAAIALLGG